MQSDRLKRQKITPNFPISLELHYLEKQGPHVKEGSVLQQVVELVNHIAKSEQQNKHIVYSLLVTKFTGADISEPCG